jgi:hypothetical protein
VRRLVPVPHTRVDTRHLVTRSLQLRSALFASNNRNYLDATLSAMNHPLTYADNANLSRFAMSLRHV